MKSLLTAAVLCALAGTATATEIRVEFETRVTQVYNLVDLTTSSIDPVTGRFSITFDDTKNLISDSDEYGPYTNFDGPWITTPLTSKIPFRTLLTPPFPQPIYFNSFTIGGTGITNVPVPGYYGPGIASQSFFFTQILNVNFPWSQQSATYHLDIGFDRAYPLEGFQPISTVEFLRSFLGDDLAGGTANLREDYRVRQFGKVNEGYRYTDNSLKLVSVTDLSAEIPEPTTTSLIAIALAGLLWRRFSTVVLREIAARCYTR